MQRKTSSSMAKDLRGICMCIRLVLSVLATTISLAASAQTVTIPAGTKVMGELDQQVTSNPKKFEVGDLVRGSVWRNVVVDGHVVIAAGTPMMLRVSDISKRRIAGRGGDVEIRAVSVTAVDGTEIFLDGGYDRQASHRTALSASLSALVFWPAIFIRGKEAVLEPGTIFDATVPANTRVTVGNRPRPIRLAAASDLSAEVLYERIEEKARVLPVRVTLCARPWKDVNVAAVNNVPVPPITFEADAVDQQGTCHVATGGIDLKALTQHFRRGINTFMLASGTETSEVI